MKKITIALILLISAAAFVMAGGAGEDMRAANLPEDSEAVALQGTIDLSGDLPVLTTADGSEYSLMLPRAYADSVEVEDGSVISIEGFAHESLGIRTESGEQVISVSSAVIGGRTYDMSTAPLAGAGAYGANGGRGFTSTDDATDDDDFRGQGMRGRGMQGRGVRGSGAGLSDDTDFQGMNSRW